MHRPISRIVLNFEEAKYQRSVEILQKDTNTKNLFQWQIQLSTKARRKGEHNIDLPYYQGKFKNFSL